MTVSQAIRSVQKASADGAAAMTTGEALVESLLAHGIDTVFALPGLHNDPLFDAFYGASDRLRVLHTRHEQAAGYMALGAAMATGKPQAFAVVPGPGFLNAGAALLTAYGVNAPVLGILGQIPRADVDRGHGHLHEIHDQIGMAAHIAKYTGRIDAPFEAPWQVRDALRSACSGRQRPSVLECSIDIWGRRGPVALEGPAPLDRAPVDEAAALEAAKLLASAKRPLIVVGGGALDASAEVLALAELLEAPVASYRRGRGVIPTDHRLAVNLPVAHRLWADADVVLAIGTRLYMQQAQWGVDAHLKVVRIDIDPLEADRFHRPAVSLVGEAADYGQAVLRHLQEMDLKRPSREPELVMHRAWLADRLSRLEPQISYLKAIRAALPRDGIFVDEVTQLGFASRLAFPVYSPRTYISPGYQDNLGWGYGAALGVKAALPDKPVVAIAGDGGFMYQASELATAVQHNIGVVVVVFDNGLYGNVRLIQNHQFGGRTICSDLTNPDFAAMARTFGMAAHTVSDAAGLEQAVREGLESGAPALVHVRCGEMPSPWDMLQLPRVRG